MVFVSRNWFKGTKEDVVSIDKRTIHDEQIVIGPYAEAGLPRNRIEAAPACGDSFNAAIQGGREPSS